MGGCFAAKFLRENGGGSLDIHVWMKKGSKVGGRTATCELAGHTYETGGSVLHSKNKYLHDALKEFGKSTNHSLGAYLAFWLYNLNSLTCTKDSRKTSLHI